MNCLTDSETTVGHFQRLFVCSNGRVVDKLAMDYLIGNVREFVEYEAADNLVVRANGKVQK